MIIWNFPQNQRPFSFFVFIWIWKNHFEDNYFRKFRVFILWGRFRQCRLESKGRERLGDLILLFQHLLWIFYSKELKTWHGLDFLKNPHISKSLQSTALCRKTNNIRQILRHYIHIYPQKKVEPFLNSFPIAGLSCKPSEYFGRIHTVAIDQLMKKRSTLVCL